MEPSRRSRVRTPLRISSRATSPSRRLRKRRPSRVRRRRTAAIFWVANITPGSQTHALLAAHIARHAHVIATTPNKQDEAPRAADEVPPTPDEAGPHDVPDDEVIDKTLPISPKN